jgi:hypothetical protein
MTHLRDAYGRPAHKVCAEDAARSWLEDQRDRYDEERFRSE